MEEQIAVRALVVDSTQTPLNGNVVSAIMVAQGGGFQLPGHTIVETDEGAVGWKYVDGVLTDTTMPSPGPTPAELKALAVSRVNRASESGIKEYMQQYPDYEVATWDKQELEAKAWEVDNAAPTPTCDFIMQERGLDKTEFMTRVLAKVALFTELAGRAAGKRQRLEDEIHELADDDPDLAAKLDAIVW